ncbi:MAG: hypothetical protein RBT34_01325 [Anaerolineaceae bacterium]|jgi:hypothetical protein|nr:hypothetical protein [Anaerolineaceae bacterium]
MKKDQKDTFITGLFLIVIGVLFVAFQFVPGLRYTLRELITWPIILVGFGLFLLIKNLIEKDAHGLVSACVILGVGAILYWQNTSGAWGDWYYWLLIPGFAGAGNLLGGLINGQNRNALQKGLWQIGFSAVLFLVFSPYLRLNLLFSQYWPVLLIAAGIVLIFNALRNK